MRCTESGKADGKTRCRRLLQQRHRLSQRAACRLAGISRQAMAYRAKPSGDQVLRERLKALGEQYPRYGYLIVHAMLKSQGLVINRKRTYRIYTELGMQVRTKKRKKLVRPRVPMAVPARPNERWSLDFVSDQLANGRRFRILNIVDDFSRACVGQLVDTSISGDRLTRFLDELSLADARLIIDQWRDHYNRVKPHSSLGYQPPALFEERVA